VNFDWLKRALATDNLRARTPPGWAALRSEAESLGLPRMPAFPGVLEQMPRTLDRERLLHALNQSLRMAEAYGDILSTFGYDEPTLLESAGRWVYYGLAGLLEKWLKFTTAHLLALVLDQKELPPTPHWCEEPRCGPFFGRTGSRLRRALVMNRRGSGKRSSRAMQCAFSLYQGKAASLNVEADFVEEQLSGAIHRLTSDKPWVDERPDWFTDLMEKSITMTVSEVFGRPRRRPRPVPGGQLLPSLRSSYQCSRAKGGAFAHILGRGANIHALLSPPVLLGYLGFREEVTPFYGPDPDLFEEGIRESRLRAQALTGIDCVPVGLLEPFKVRVITKGDADAYHLCRRYQRLIHPRLAEHPVFRLTRGPITPEILKDFASKRQGLPLLVSGDYEAATDNLDPYLSEFALGAICTALNLPFEDRLVLHRGLTGHVLHRKVGDPGVDQTWGQLMGSPISFPILCVINAAVTRLAMDRRNFEINPRPLSALPLLINGDDVGFEATPGTYELWKTYTAWVGLKFSLGKNYTHEDILILNSQMYSARKDWAQLHHLESGLLYAGNDVRGTQDHDGANLDSEVLYLSGPRSLASRLEKLVAPFPWAREHLIRRFVSINRKLLDQVPLGMSWFLPRPLGGLGLPAPAEGRDRLCSRQQLKLAAYLATRPAEDRDVADLLVPQAPDFLRAYQSARNRCAEQLSLPYRYAGEDEILETDTMPFLSGWAGVWGSEDSTEPGEVEHRVKGAFRRLWRTAQACPLEPMGVDKALQVVRRRVRELPEWR